ncbi:retinol dehydrogenase 14b [Brachyhypopomus gauderio]|uniref:retinol dehydrogenase 14b n=1 Tax=Brachyhypopomus gauderio TaxID=698409 RepID=UPI00404316D3
MAAGIILAAVLGGGVILIMKIIFSRRKITCYPVGIMRGKTVIITGANSGIGKATAAELLRLQARVIMACRDMQKAEEAAGEIRKESGPHGELVIKHLNLASLRSIHSFCEEIMKEEIKIDVLINNAGLYQCPYAKTEDGFEMQIGVNHLGHFLLTHLLLDHLKNSAPSRIIVVSSELYKYGSINFDDLNCEQNYNKASCYSQSKLANLLFIHELSRQLYGTGVTVNALTPGIVRTRLGRHIHIPLLAKPLFFMVSWLFFKSAMEGAQTPLYLACSPEVANVTGKYFANCQEKQLLAKAVDDHVAKRLWDLSGTLVGLKS